MKKIIIILSLILLAGCKSTTIKTTRATEPEKTGLNKLALSAIDNVQKARAYELGKRILMTCNTSKFKPFSTDEATQSIINNITLEKLSKTCNRYRQYYGDFKDIELTEIYKDYDDATTIFRYKALYTKEVANKELRVYMNEENKVSGIKSMDWETTFERKK
ncbi:hypothetical protein HNQ02_003206 [Flavobacterium sp. 7E]|uniref:hypothetical protein n=1 Tax=unclassified Flavobacterium TaxID=196869 RepID=UPI0015706ED1|nr:MULTISPECIES: hypothetical protein [unclassified Flavobacterium]MBE0393328.1 hypothetical protein [Flavobacterium sp. PL002]NRS90268.1 hypothetical protein [Flavobacterium sp. 7E]